MELLQLRYFVVIAKCQSFTKAAAELMVSQPALSKMMKSLEDQLKVKLFERRGRSIHLNRSGELFYKTVSKSLLSIDDAVLHMSEMAETETGKLHILVSAASTFFVKLYMEFHKKYPNIKIFISNYIQNEQLLVNDYDIAIYSSVGNVVNKESHILISERFVLAVPFGHPLAGRRQINLAEAEPYPFIASSDRMLLQDSCRKAGFIPNIIFQCDNGYTFNTFLENNLGCTIVPEITMAHTLPKNLVTIPFINPEIRRDVILSCNRHRYISRSAQLFKAEAFAYAARYAKDDIC